MSRDYQTEVIEYLKKTPVNGVDLAKLLEIRQDKMYGILRGLENAGKIKFVQISPRDGVWQVQEV